PRTDGITGGQARTAAGAAAPLAVPQGQPRQRPAAPAGLRGHLDPLRRDSVLVRVDEPHRLHRRAALLLAAIDPGIQFPGGGVEAHLVEVATAHALPELLAVVGVHHDAVHGRALRAHRPGDEAFDDGHGWRP